MSKVKRIEELEQDLEFYKMLGIKHYERPYAKRYLEEKRKERPNLLYPDSEEIYKDFYEAKEEIERLNKELENLEKLNNANYQSFIEANNIVIKLEKWLKEKIEIRYDDCFCLSEVLGKLQELKGADK